MRNSECPKEGSTIVAVQLDAWLELNAISTDSGKTKLLKNTFGVQA